jgi:hypothetical protein
MAQPHMLITFLCNGTHNNHSEIVQLVSHLPGGVMK